jgi:predicted NUDIX family NTP pyrophosphohydrolase
MALESAGILMWRVTADVEVLLTHFGGPYWRNKDDGAWTLPKGLIEPGETPEQAARREFEEELGSKPEGPLVPLGRIRQRGGKYVEAFALEGDLDCSAIRSITMKLEWPPRSGRFQDYPEVDRAEWFPFPAARIKILPSQLPLLERLEQLIT